MLKMDGLNGYTLQVRADSTSQNAKIIVEDYADSDSTYWTLEKITEPPSDLYMFSTVNGSVITSLYKEIDPTDELTLSQLNLQVIFYSDTTIDQTVTWSSNNSSVVTVNSSGKITGISPGTATITAIKEIKTVEKDAEGNSVVKETSYSLSYTVKVRKKAIIILPGVMGSELVGGLGSFYCNEGDVLWSDELYEDFKKGLLSKLDAGKRVSLLRRTSNGSSINAVAPRNEDNYGAADIYKNLYEGIKTAYENEYSIVFFAYDWRLSNATSAQELNNFINNQNYDKVVLVCHSMGGLVASSYLSLGTSQRSKVETIITLGTPFLGTSMMPYLWGSENVDLILDFKMGEWGTKLAEFAKIHGDFIDYLIGNFPSLYELFPTEKYFDNAYAGKSYLVSTLMGSQLIITTYADTRLRLDSYYDFFNMTLLDSAEDFHDSLYINGEHVTNLVNTYYISGYGIQTMDKIEFDMLTWDVFSYTNQGDKLVPTWSAALADKYPDRTFYVSGVEHIDLVKETDIINFVIQLISGNSSTSNYNRISEEMD